MLYLGIIFICILILLIFILFIPFKVETKLGLINDEFQYSVKITALNFKLVQISDKIDNTLNFAESKINKYNSEIKDKASKSKTYKIIETIKKLNLNQKQLLFRRVYCKHRSNLRKLRVYIKKHILLSNVELFITQGTGDAASTAILSGAIWALLSNALAFISNYINIEIKNIRSDCDFNNKLLKIKCNCIINFRLADIILVALRLLILFLLVKLFIRKTLKGGGFNV